MPDFSRYNNDISAPLNKVQGAISRLSARASTTGQMVMQHGMNLEAASHQHALAKDLASHTGAINSNLSAQEHAQASALSAQEHGQRVKETAASNRHEIKKIVLNHNNDLEKTAVTHNNSMDTLRTGSTLKVSEEKAAHKNAVDLVGRLHASAEGGTPVSFTHGGITGTFTSKVVHPATNPTPTVAPVKNTKQFMGMPSMPTPAAPAPEGPKPTVTRGPGGKMVSLKNAPAVAPKKTAAKKPVAKGQPTVTRDPKTGRMIGIKKK